MGFYGIINDMIDIKQSLNENIRATFHIRGVIIQLFIKVLRRSYESELESGTICINQ